MPALPPVPGVFKIRLHYDVGTDANAVTILHVRYVGTPPTSGDCVTFCTTFNGLAAAEWPIYLDTDSSYLGVDITDLTTPTSGTGSDGTTVAGTRSGTKLGAGTAVLTHMPVSRRYRGGKPRSYLPWGTASDLDSRNTWLSGSVTDFHTGWSAILTAIGTAFPVGPATFGSFCSVSYYGPPNRTVTGSTGRVRTISTTRTTPLIDDWGTFTVSPKVSSQRRRNLQR